MASQVLKHKLVLLGNSYAGKSSVIIRFINNTFDYDYNSTIGMDYQFKTVTIDDRVIKFQIWDAGWHGDRQCLIPYFIRDSSIALIVFDITNRRSFDDTKYWIREVKNERGTNAIIILVGNKIDKAKERCVTSEEAAAKGRKAGAIYIEVSAKFGFNIKTLFNQIVARWLATEENVAH